MSVFRYTPAVMVCFAISGLLHAVEPVLHAVEPVAYSELSDEQLQVLVQRWGTLAVEERRAVATEVQRRTGTEGRAVRIESHRRYGYRVRQPDGSVLTVEGHRKIIRFVDPDRPYGVGFEERVGTDSAPVSPVERVNHQNGTAP